MNLNPNELSETLKRLNPHLFVGAVDRTKPEPHLAQPLVGVREKRKEGTTRVVVSLIRFGRRILDDDNNQGAFKPLRDAVSKSLGIDDADPRVRWEYGQCETRGEIGTIVKIQEIQL